MAAASSTASAVVVAGDVELPHLGRDAADGVEAKGQLRRESRRRSDGSQERQRGEALRSAHEAQTRAVHGRR